MILLTFIKAINIINLKLRMVNMIKSCINLAINSIRILLIKNKRRITDLNYIFLLACYELLKSCDLDPQPSANIATKKPSSDIEEYRKKILEGLGNYDSRINDDDNNKESGNLINIDSNGKNIAPNTIDIDTSNIHKRGYIGKELTDNASYITGHSSFLDGSNAGVKKFFQSQKDENLKSFSNYLPHPYKKGYKEKSTKLFKDNKILHEIIEKGHFETEKDCVSLCGYISSITNCFEDLLNQEDDEGDTPLYSCMKDKPNIMMLNALIDIAAEPKYESPKTPKTQFLHVNKKGETFLHLSIKCGSIYVEKCLNTSVMSYQLHNKNITYKDYYINKKTDEGKSALDICLDLMKRDFKSLDDTIKTIHNTEQSFSQDLYKTLTLLISGGAKYDKQKLLADLDDLNHSTPKEEDEIKNLITLQQPNIKILPSFDNDGLKDNSSDQWNYSGGLPNYEDFNCTD